MKQETRRIFAPMKQVKNKVKLQNNVLIFVQAIRAASIKYLYKCF